MGETKIDQEVANILATGAPGKIVLDGDSYLVEAPTDTDMMAVAFEALKVLRVKRQKLALEGASAVASSGPDAIRAVMREILGEQRAASNGQPAANDAEALLKFDTAEFMEAMQEPDGCAFLAWVCLRKNHPDLPLKKLRQVITEENVGEVLLTLLQETRLGTLRANFTGGTGSAA